MKRTLALWLCLVLLWAALPVGVGAETVTGTYKGMTYTIENGTVTLTGYTKDIAAYLTIPSTIEGYPVTAIGYKAFEDCQRLRSVNIPDSVRTLDDYAFAWCHSLKTVTVGDGVLNTSYGTFSYCGVQTISFGTSLRDLHRSTFLSCRSLQSIQVAENNPYYRSVDGVLYDKDVTRLLYYPGGKEGAFVFPDTVTSFVDIAFDFCRTITSVTFPAGITAFPEGAFYSCEKLTAFYVADGNPALYAENGVLFNKDKTTLITCPSGKRGSYTVPNGVTALESSAFVYCQYLTSLHLPNTLTTIGDNVFSYCHWLTSITIPDSVTAIGQNIFYDCNNLATVRMSDGITTLPEMTFYDCSKLSTIYLPDHLTYIGYGAFSHTAYVNNAANWTGDLLYWGTYLIAAKETIAGDCVPAEDTTVIGRYVFHGYEQLTSITIPEGVRAIEFSTFNGCKSLTTVYLPKSMTFLGEYAFYDCPKLTDVYYGGSIEDRKSMTFSPYNSPLTNATWHYNYAPQPELLPGDVNGDSRVNNRDLGLLQQYLNEFAVTIDTTAADLDGNGRINNRDLGRLQQLLNV